MSAIAQSSNIRTERQLLQGWWVVMASAVALFLGPIPISVFSFGVFLQPWAHDFHASRGAISLARMIHSIVLPIGLPFAGRLLDRYGGRKVILPSAVASGLVLLSACFIGNLRQFYIFYLVLGLATCGVAPPQYCGVVS